jgi:Tfp pilus assembly protein PilN
MSLHINLIEEGEKRHGGSIPLVFILRSVGIVVPLLILLFISHLLITSSMYRTQLARTEERIADKNPQLALSAQIMKQQKTYRDLLAQLKGWNSMRLDWNQQLASIQEAVPLEVQLTSLTLLRKYTVTNNMPVTAYALVVNGKTGGATPEANLTRFRQNMQKSPGLTNYLEEVTVPEGAFVEDTSPGSRAMDRLFEVNCRYQPRELR